MNYDPVFLLVCTLSGVAGIAIGTVLGAFIVGVFM